MKYYLILWITGCVGLNCPVPDYVSESYETQETCSKALDAAMKVAELTKKKYAGICLPEDAMERINGQRIEKATK